MDAVVVEMVPQIAAAIRLCIEPTGGGAPSGVLVGHLLYYSGAVLKSVPRALDCSSGCEQRCRAADAWLRLLPLLSRVHTSWRCKAESEDLRGLKAELHPVAASEHLFRLGETLWRWAVAQPAGFLVRLGPAAALTENVAASREADAAWQLHSTACRLLHWSAAQGAEHQLATLDGFAFLPGCMSHTLHLACEAAEHWTGAAIAGGRQDELASALRRRIQAICSAHAQVLPLLEGKQGAPLLSRDMLQVVSSVPAPLLTPELLSTFDAVIRQDWQQAASSGAELCVRLDCVLAISYLWPPLTALLFSSGLLLHGLHLATQPGLLSTQQAKELVGGIFHTCHKLSAIGSSELDKCHQRFSARASGSSLPVTTISVSALTSAMVPLRAALQRCGQQGGGAAAPAALTLLHHYQSTIIPAAAQLAVALQSWWAEPEQQAAARLEAAQAASTRSCAYLCCANLEASGGPAAGPGQGTKRCSNCRSVWYCGTACSHADWRAGHRRVCKALAAARQAAA